MLQSITYIVMYSTMKFPDKLKQMMSLAIKEYCCSLASTFFTLCLLFCNWLGSELTAYTRMAICSKGLTVLAKAFSYYLFPPPAPETYSRLAVTLRKCSPLNTAV